MTRTEAMEIGVGAVCAWETVAVFIKRVPVGPRVPTVSGTVTRWPALGALFLAALFAHWHLLPRLARRVA